MGEHDPSSLSSHLRHLLSLLGCYNPLQSLSYRGTLQTLASLNPLDFRKVGVVQDEEYSLLLLKKIILSTFELLCVSLELVHDVRYSYEEVKSILLSVEQFNKYCSDLARKPISLYGSLPSSSRLSRKRMLGLEIELADLTEVYIRSHVKWLASTLYSNLSSQNLLHLVKFERSFSKALLGLIATYTSLVNAGSGTLKEFVSLEMISMEPSNNGVSWMDCLIPGAQSEILRIASRDVFNRIWNNVAENLVAKAQPVLAGGWIMKEFVPWLSTASQHPGILLKYN